MRLKLFKQAIEANASAMVILEVTPQDIRQPQRIIYANQSFEDLTGYSRAKIAGGDWRMLCDREANRVELERLDAAIGLGRREHVVLRCIRKDGSVFWNDVHLAPLAAAAGETTVRYVATLHDITAMRRHIEQLERRAHHDALTGLPNRHLLCEKLSQAVEQARRLAHRFAVVFIDLDRFKIVNDCFGHHIGDEVLKQVALRLVENLRAQDIAARLGGDEFVLLLSGGKDLDAVHEAVGRIGEALRQTVMIDGREMTMSCSIGISLFPADGLDPESLLKNADLAMYRKKAHSPLHARAST